MWRNKPLFKRPEDKSLGDGLFRTGSEAAQILSQAARRLDPDDPDFLESADSVFTALAPVFERVPKYAWVAKQLLEPDRALVFRVSWLDDKGVVRVNRGYRYQYSSTLGPYEGPLHFRGDLSSNLVKAHGFDLVLSNAITGYSIGAAVGGANFSPDDKSEAEIQSFCQAYMTQLNKYIGPMIDAPTMGTGVGAPEMGYLYGQYKRLNGELSPQGLGLLWGGMPGHAMCAGYGVASFTQAMLNCHGDDLKGKRCLITGSGKVAIHVAEKLQQMGAIPLTFSDESGHIYEPGGFDTPKLNTFLKAKEERGARVGRYIVDSASSTFNDPEDIFSIPCDIAFLCATNGQLTKEGAHALVKGGCKTVVDGAWKPVTQAATKVLRKHDILHAPYRGTMVGATVGGGRELERNPLALGETLEDRVETKMKQVFEDAFQAAADYNARGDLAAGCAIAGFLRVAKGMVAHGSV